MTKDDFVKMFEAIPPQNLSARTDLIYRATYDFNVLTPEQGSVWRGRAESEARPAKQNVTTGYVQETPVKDPARPNDRSMSKPVHHPDGIEEFKKHANATPPKSKAAASFQPLGPFVEVRYP